MGALTDRGKLRLRVLAGLLRGQGHNFEMSRDQVYVQIQDVVAALPAERQEHLKSLCRLARKIRIGGEPTLARQDPRGAQGA